MAGGCVSDSRRGTPRTASPTLPPPPLPNDCDCPRPPPTLSTGSRCETAVQALSQRGVAYEHLLWGGRGP